MIPKKRSGPIWLFLVALTVTVTVGDWSKATAQETVFVVSRIRGASVADKTFTDEGKQKAQALSRMLMDADIDVIYAMDRSTPV